MILEAAKKLFATMTGAEKNPPELHQCPTCGAGIQRLYIIHGGIIRMGASSKVKMLIGCRDCHISHSYKGKSFRAHWLALQLANHPVRSYRQTRYSVA